MKTNDAKAFFTGLYHELKDRQMLLPAVALLVAIFAVPMLLGGSPSQPAAPAPTATAASDDATAVRAAVVTADPGIRDYRQRLEALKKKNPFIQQFAPEPESASEQLDQTAADAGATGTGSTPVEGTGPPVPGSGGESPANLPPAGTEGSTTTATTPTGSTDTGATGGDTTEQQTQPTVEHRFYAPRVDVTFGELGQAKEYDDLRHFDFLPDEQTPVVAFLGLGESADKAVFAVSNEVTDTSGDGSCVPPHSDGCQFLVLRIGEQRMLSVPDPADPAAAPTTYRVKVLDTRYTRIPDPRG